MTMIPTPRTRLSASLWPALGFLLGAIGCARTPAGVSPDWPYSGASRVVRGQEAAVVSGSPIASRVGLEVLGAGGNAIDAAVAVAFALAVVHPEAGNLGGGGFLLFRDPAGEVYSLDFREVAPAAATRDMYLDALGATTDRSLLGHLASGVPGSVAGLEAAHRRFGQLPWRALVEPAVRLAREGFEIDAYRHQSIRDAAARLARFPASAAAFLPAGSPPPIGSVWRQPDLASTLELIRDLGGDGFYRGRVADLIVAEMTSGGGLITHVDLAGYRPLWREPIRATYRGYAVYSMPPPSSGGITLALLLNILEGWDSLPSFGSPELLHLQAESMRRAFIDRNRWLGDPDFVVMPVERLLSKAYGAELRGTIDLDRASRTPAFETATEADHTTHFSVVDAAGGAVAVTTTLNESYGSAVTVAGAGFLLNDEMDDFTTAPGRPNLYGLIQGEANAIAPRKRMLSAMTPTILLDPSGELWMVLGSPGGPRIITTVLGVISNAIDQGMSLADAVAAPRIHHQAWPDRIQLERDGFPEQTLEALRARGHQVEALDVTGDVEAILRVPGGWLGVSDPRRGGGGAAR